MKKILIIVTLLAAQVAANAKDWAVEKEKKVHNQYTVHATDKFLVDNIYGKVRISTWDKNEVTVDITATVKAGSDADAQAVLDRIKFEIAGNENGGHRISYKTMLERSVRDVKSSMSIDYTIYMPKTLELELANKYGDVFLGDFSGRLDVDVKYGAFSAEDITGADKKIKVSFGNATVHSLETGILTIGYSNLVIDKANDIDISNKYGKTEIGTVQRLKLDQKYGNAEIRTVGELDGDIAYANLEAEHLLKSVVLEAKYSGNTSFRSIDAKVDKINIRASYSTLHFGLSDKADMAINIDARYTHVSTGAMSGTLQRTGSERAGSSMEYYKGQAGAGKGKMTVDAQYCNVNFR